MQIIPIETHVDTATCTSCGGKCCKQMPGAASPRNFPDEESIRAAIATGRWAFDWWEGDPTGGDNHDRAYYIRPATKGNEGRLRDPSWGGICTFLTDAGCELPVESRPDECLGLKPKTSPDGKCSKEHSDKQDMAIAWLPRQQEFRNILFED